MARNLEEFELLNTASQLRRAAEHVFVFYRGAIRRDECTQVVDESYDLLAKTARIKHHLVPLAEMWSIDRLRRMAVLDQRFTATTPEVLFIDGADETLAPLAAALLASYARGRVQVSSAGLAPGAAVNDAVAATLREVGIEPSEAFCKPVTDDAIRAADLVVLLGNVPQGAVGSGTAPGRVLHWDVEDLTDTPDDLVRAVRDELDRRSLRLLADLLGPATPA